MIVMKYKLVMDETQYKAVIGRLDSIDQTLKNTRDRMMKITGSADCVMVNGFTRKVR